MRLLKVILFVAMLKLNPLYAQTYMYVGKLGHAPVFKRAEKYFGDYSVCEYNVCKEYKNKHIGWTYDGDEEGLPNSKEYKYCEIKGKPVQILSGMNMCEVIFVKEFPTYKEVFGNKEILYWHDGTSIEFKNGIIN